MRPRSRARRSPTATSRAPTRSAGRAGAASRGRRNRCHFLRRAPAVRRDPRGGRAGQRRARRRRRGLELRAAEGRVAVRVSLHARVHAVHGHRTDQHGPPLAFGSCNPPQQASGQLTRSARRTPTGSLARLGRLGPVPGGARRHEHARRRGRREDGRRRLPTCGGRARSPTTRASSSVEQVVQITDRPTGRAQTSRAPSRRARSGMAVPCAATPAPRPAGSASRSRRPSTRSCPARSRTASARSGSSTRSTSTTAARTARPRRLGDNALFERQGVFVP